MARVRELDRCVAALERADVARHPALPCPERADVARHPALPCPASHTGIPRATLPAGSHVAELEQMVMHEEELRTSEAAEARRVEDGLRTRLAALSLASERAAAFEAEVADTRAAHSAALEAARSGEAAAREHASAAEARSQTADAEAERLRAAHERASQALTSARAAEEAAKAERDEAGEQAQAARRREAEMRAELHSSAIEVAHAEAARAAAERRATMLSEEISGVSTRLEEATAERRGTAAREAEAEQRASTLSLGQRALECRAVAAEAQAAAEGERVRRLREEIEGLLRTLGETQQQSHVAEQQTAVLRQRERALEEGSEAARRELAAERSAHAAAEVRVETAAKECAVLTNRLHAQLEREREARTAAERRANEYAMSQKAELVEAQRQLAGSQRARERLAQASRGAAAAYCCRLLLSRTRGQLDRALSRWRIAASEADARDRTYAAEERARQQLLQQAQNFQARLQLLEYQHDAMNGGRESVLGAVE